MSTIDWWKKAVFYQIYPRSFADSNGDGIGDFPGITSRLDYLQDLGVDALWISPCFPSPLYDVGYDISDYTSIAPEYGSLDDFLEFLDQSHQRGLRVVLDLVMNHTSHLHPWFLESRTSRINLKRDWYIWKDGINGKPPNNWDSTFGGSAWEYDEETNQYYYHFFFKEQPDLNWHNLEVKEAMWDVVRYWLRLGVDGYRLDAIGTIFEDPLLGDHTAPMGLAQLQMMVLQNPDEGEHEKYWKIAEKIFEKQIELPDVHTLMKELRQVVDEFPDRVLVGESDLISYYGNGGDELHLVFNFPLMRTNRITPAWVRNNQVERLKAIPPGAWSCNTLGNHDNSRVKSAFGDSIHDFELARLSLALVLTLQGTPFLYYGEEIGMTDFILEHPTQLCDNQGIYTYETLVNTVGLAGDEAMKWAAKISRDRCRTPMQWKDAPAGGFSINKQTWLPVNPSYAEGINVASQLEQPQSMLNFYKRLLQVRRNSSALQHGSYKILNDHDDYLAFMRTCLDDKQTCLVILNMSDKDHMLDMEGIGTQVKIMYSSHQPETMIESSLVRIQPFEIFIGELIS
jgi:alpha-glucosidase